MTFLSGFLCSKIIARATIQVPVMKNIGKGAKQEKSSNINKTNPAKSAIDLPPYEEMVRQLQKNGVMTEEDIRALENTWMRSIAL